jgi:predicted dehydrogenase
MGESTVPIAVVGAGKMGANHIRVYDELAEAELVEVVEPNPDRARRVADSYDVEVHKSVAQIEHAKAATVAVPNRRHKEVAEECIRAGLDLLVEKPLAMTVEDANAIVELADEHGAILQVGHIERFNPAVEAVEEILQNHRIVALDAQRLGPFNEHLTKESVVFDLMIHDLDLITDLASAEVETLNAVGTNLRSENLDHAIATIRFDNGIIASGTSSHVTHGKVRTLNVTTEEAYFELGYLEQDLTIQRRGIEGTTSLENRSGYRTETITESPFIKRREPLKNEIEHFLSCVVSRSRPRVDGTVGVQAVELASSVIQSIRDVSTNREGSH